MEAENSLSCSKEPAPGPYSDPDESNSYPRTLFKICFNYYLLVYGTGIVQSV
jgi:hypothetical protein